MLVWARPGFNQEYWLRLPFDQAVLLGWLGLQASGTAPLTQLQQHIRDYCPKIAQFHGLDQAAARQYINKLLDRQQIQNTLKTIAATTNVLSDFELSENQLHFEFNPQQLEKEIAHLK